MYFVHVNVDRRILAYISRLLLFSSIHNRLCISEAARSLKLDACRFVYLLWMLGWNFASLESSLWSRYTQNSSCCPRGCDLPSCMLATLTYPAGSLSWSVFHFSTILAVTALFLTTLLAASTLSARFFFPDIATDSARTFSPTNSHMVGHVTLLSGYCLMTDRYHKPCSIPSYDIF